MNTNSTKPIHLLSSPFSAVAKSLLVAFAILALAGGAWGQANGDYRTRDSGDWNAIATWSIYDGGWRNANAADGYPGELRVAGTVQIQNNQNVTLNVSPLFAISNLHLLGGNRASYVTFNGTNELSVVGELRIFTPTSTNTDRYKYVRVLAGTLNVGLVTMDGSGNDGRDSYIEISTGTLNVTNDIAMGSTGLRTYIYFTGAGDLNIGGTITGGIITSTQYGHLTNPPTSGNVNYNNTGDQTIGAYTYYNLETSGGGTKTLAGNTTVNNNLTLTSGVLSLGEYNLTHNGAAAILGGAFSAANMIETNGNGYYHRQNAAVPYTIPIGSNGAYSPVTVESVSPSTWMRFRSVYNTTLGSQYLKRYWSIQNSGNATATLTFGYDAAENPKDPTSIWSRTEGGSWAAPTGTESFDDVNKTFTITGTSISNTTSEWTAGFPLNTYFTYQEEGDWNVAETWTTDPGGTTLVGSKVPDDGDVVVILPNRKVYLPSDVATTGLEININEGGILDMGDYSFTAGLAALKGTGTLMLSSTSFPSATINTFIEDGGGTTEYYNTSNFTFAQGTYNNLSINLTAGVVATQLSDITLNGNLIVKQGTYRINDNTTAAKLNLTILGDVIVNSGAFITVGNGSTNTTATPTGITGGTAPFLNYYEHFHRVVINGNFTNNGTVRFTNLDYPVYNLFPPTGNTTASGAASVYFQGNASSTMLCNGTTDFYNLILDKGTDQTHSLVIQPSVYSNFRLFGANNAATTINVPDPDLMKALWIRNGTLVLRGHVVIPSLTEGAIANSEYYIPYSGALVLDGPDVVVLNTADDYGEVNIAYNVSGGTGAVNGVNNANADRQGLVVYGKLTVNDGYLSTRESPGLLYSHIASGQIEINNGTVDAKQFRNYTGTASGAAYRQNGGTLILRGRFVRPVAYAAFADLKSTSGALSARAVNGTSANYGTFNLNNSSNLFYMSGGTIKIYDASGNFAGGNPQFAVDVVSSIANTSVTGGTFEILPQTGTVLDDAATLLLWCEEAVYGNVTINRGPSCSTLVRLRNRTLNILNNFIITSGQFESGGQDIRIGGNFTVSADGDYNSANTTILNGKRNQTVTINGIASINNLTLDRTTDTVKVAGTQPGITISGALTISGGVINDGGKTIAVSGNLTQSGIHVGTGKIQLNGTQTQTISGNGTGVFQNIEFNNSNAVNDPISFTASKRINGEATFTTDKSVSLSTHNLTFGPNASVTGAGTGTYRYFTTSGAAGDGGITKEYSSTTAFEFPIGVNQFTPASIGLTAEPTAYGSITIKPVAYEHPNVTATGRSLTYFWRVQQSGFDLGTANVNHTYTYSQANVITSGDVTEDGYVAARYNPTTFTWTKGTTADVNEATNVISFNAINTIDGEFTAGDDTPTDPFGATVKYYSRQSGEWRDYNTWSKTDHSGLPDGTWPSASDIVIIANGHTVTFGTPAGYLTTPNTQPNSCATLQIEQGGVLDTRFNPSSTFRMVVSHPNGNGTIRVAANYTTNTTFQFPGGDFSDFNENLGSTELYTTNPNAGTIYWLPNGVFSYGNLTLSPLGGSNIIFPNHDLLLYGNLVTQGQNADSWFCPTWVNQTAYPTPPTVPVAKTITIMGNLDIQGGGLIWIGNGDLAQDFIVHGDVIVSPWGAIAAWTGYGGANNQSMSIGGSLINNTNNITGNGATQTPSRVNFSNGASVVPVTFFGNSNASITHIEGAPGANGPGTIFNTVTINKGTSQATTLTLDIGGTLTTPVDNWLTLQNGTLKYMRTNPSTDFTISQNTAFTIPTTAGLHVEYTTDANRRILIANTNNPAQGDNSDVYLEGKLTIVGGNVFIGQPDGAAPRNNDIEYSGSGESHIDIQGGNLMVNGQVRRNPAMSGGILKYTQSGGTVTINGQNASTNNAKFEVVNTGSVFNMSGGTLRFVRGGGSNFGDIYIRPHSSSVTGGTIEIQPIAGISEAQEQFTIDANVPLNNLTITGSGATDAARVSLSTNPLLLKGNLTLSNGNSFLTSNNLDVTVGGDFTNNGLPANYVYGTNTTIFNGGIQQLNGSSATHFNNLTINPVTSLTLANGNNVDVNGNLTLTSGTLACGNFAVNLKGNITNNARYTDTQYGVILNGTSLQNINGTGDFARLEVNNTFGARTLADITLTKNLALTLGVLDIKDYKLSLGATSTIEGSGFGTSKMIITDGVFSAKGISKVVPSGPSTFTYPMGVSGKFTPVTLTVTSNETVGTVRLNNVNSRHPAVIDPSNVLQYYWDMETSDLTGFVGSLELNYLQGDVAGTDEDQYQAAQMEASDIVWKFFDSVDEDANTITFVFSSAPGVVNNLTGEYTAGVETAFPGEVPVFTTVKDGAWNDETVWLRTAGDDYTLPVGSGPNGFIVIINHEVETNANYCQSYRTTINGKLKVIRPFFGHNFGSVNGSGTLYLEQGLFPAGRFGSFFSCTNSSTLEYGGSTDYNIIADLYSEVYNLVFSGTGLRRLPSKTLTICNRLEIDGPTLDNTINNSKLIVKGDMLLTSGAFSSGTGDNATVEFAGNAPQTIANFSGTNKFNNLQINNSQGLTLNSTIEVGNKLLLTNGVINSTSVNILYISNPLIDCVTPSGGSSTSYVSGPLKKRMDPGLGFFRYPIGNSSTAGNMLSLRATQFGTLDWTVEYINPSALTSFIGDLSSVNETEYWNVTTPPGGDAIVSIAWNPSSNLTPLMTENGTADMRIAEHNGDNWVEIASSVLGGSDNYNGGVETTERRTIPMGGSRNYTLACINTPKPRIRLAPDGPICGDSGIPIVLSSSFDIFETFTINYTEDGSAMTYNPTSFPATLPTSVNGATYILTGFTYYRPAGVGPHAGAVDITPVTSYAVPTTSNAGPNQSHCGATLTTLAANDPSSGVGTGLWSIVTGAGGSVAEPTNPTSEFTGITGNSYTLRWTISNGTCTSTDDVIVTFPLLPAQPSNFTASPTPVCQGAEDLIYTVPNDPLIDSYTWSFSGTGATIAGSTHSVSIDFANDAEVGTFTLTVIASNDCGDSPPQNTNVEVRSTPTATLSYFSGDGNICDGDNVDITVTIAGGVAPYSYVISNGTVDETRTEVTDLESTFTPHVDNTPIWLGPDASTIYQYIIQTITSSNGCSSSGSNILNVTVWKNPETGPQYHIPNTHGM